MSARILILYSNPANTERLRLDQEHRRMDQALSQTGSSPFEVLRRHAVTVLDVTRELSSQRYEVIHFSGHGSSDGLYVDNAGGETADLLSAAKLARMVKETQPSLAAIVLMTCFSAELLHHFAPCAPYIVSVCGPADDSAAVEFVGLFYEEYFRSRSVVSAFNLAQNLVDERLNASLFRKRPLGNDTHVITIDPAVYPSRHHDPIFVDLSAAEQSIQRLDVPRDKFLQILSRKMRIHRWLFEGERERVVIPVGQYFAVFSWTNAYDLINCHSIVKLKSQLSPRFHELLAQIIVEYNGLHLLEYRRLPNAVDQSTSTILKRGIDKLHELFDGFFKKEENFSVLASVNPDFMEQIRATCWANLRKADEKFLDRDYRSAVIAAETALSSFHDTVDELLESVSD